MTATAPEPAPDAACAHCGLPTPAASGGGAVYCCAGCRTAAAVIAGAGLGAFYRLRGEARGEPAPPPPDADEAQWLASAAFAAVHVRTRADGLAELRWYVQGLHCPACTWLLERLPWLDAGIKAARVDLGEHALAVLYDPAACPPPRQAALVAGLGYRLRPAGGAADARRRRAEARIELLRFAVAAASAIGSMHLAVNLAAGELTRDLDAAGRGFFSWLALAVALPALTWGAAPLWRGALGAMRARRATIDLLASAVLAVVLAASAGQLAVGGGALYADAGAMFVAVLLAGRLAFRLAHRRALAAAGRHDPLLPAFATRVDGGRRTVVAAGELAVGDVVAVADGGVLPGDGSALGDGWLDRAVISGESRPLAVAAGDAVLAGSRNRGGELLVRIAATGAATRVGGLLAQAALAGARARGADRAERWQGAFAVVVAALAVAAWLVWRAIDPARSLDQAIAIVLVCCPCALGLAAPLVRALATARAAAGGVALRDAAALDALAGVRELVLDKTGTLTAGAPAVTAWEWQPGVAPELRAQVAAWTLAAEERSRHPVADAIVAHLRAQGVQPQAVQGWRELVGQGVAAGTPLGELRCGNAAFAAQAASGRAGNAGTWLSLDGLPLARIAMRDPLAPGIAGVLAGLRARGCRLHLLSGDDPAVVAAVGRELGFAPARVRGGQTPADKAAYIAGLRATGAAVAMVGDGANDALALAAADAGIGLRGGLESCLDCCSAFVARGDVGAVPALIDGARTARSTLRATLAVAAFYNLAGVACVFAGWWGPLVCAVAMPLSSLSVVAVALARLRPAGATTVPRPARAAVVPEQPAAAPAAFNAPPTVIPAR